MANWINKLKTFAATYGVARYGISVYGRGTTGAGNMVNKPKN